MPTLRGSFAVLLWSFVAALAAQPPAAPSPNALLARFDPAGEVWLSERLQSAATERLARHLEGSEEVVASARSTRLLPAGSAVATTKLGEWTLRRWVPTEAGGEIPATEALARWRTETLGARRKIKVVSVEIAPERLVLIARIESVYEDDDGRHQETARWRLEWERGGADGLELSIERLGLLAWQRSTRTAPAFEEVSAGLFGASPPRAAALGRGGDWWPGRIDAVGELPLMGHNGVCVGDVNNDGLEDLYVGMPTGLPNQLWVRDREGVLRESAEMANVAWLDDTKGCLFADMDGDGDEDLLAAVGPTIIVARNDGKGRFDRFASIRARTPAAFYQLSVCDYDLDGDLDIYAVRYVAVRYGTSVPLPYHDAQNGPSNLLLRNDGELRFSDVTRASGLDVNNRRFSVACAWGDVDGDGDADLYVANDFGRNNLYVNEGGRFVDRAAAAGVEDQAAGMGASFGDFDGDGDLDLYVTNMWSSAGQRIAYQAAFQAGATQEELLAIRAHGLGNSLFLNRGDGRFERAGKQRGVRVGRWGWGARFCDLNADGRLDLVAPNGFLSGRVKDDL